MPPPNFTPALTQKLTASLEAIEKKFDIAFVWNPMPQAIDGQPSKSSAQPPPALPADNKKPHREKRKKSDEAFVQKVLRELTADIAGAKASQSS